MEDCLKLKTTKNIVEEILARHEGKNFFQCGKCCSIKSDAKELASTLYIITQASIDSKGDFIEGIGECCSDLLHQIILIGMPEACYADSKFYAKWLTQNEERLLPELDNHWNDIVFVRSRDVVLKIDDQCESCKKAL